MDAELDAHGHELDDRHPELDEVRDLLDEPGVRSAPFLHSRARMRGEAFHVELVHDRVRLVARAAVVTFVAPSTSPRRRCPRRRCVDVPSVDAMPASMRWADVYVSGLGPPSPAWAR